MDRLTDVIIHFVNNSARAQRSREDEMATEVFTVVGRGDVLAGPVRRPVNASRDAVGSIHDDNTAQTLGFRGGTVAGNIHFEQFPPLMLARFGEEWRKRGGQGLRRHVWNHRTGVPGWPGVPGPRLFGGRPHSALGESPKTEVAWYESTLRDRADGRPLARLIMMGRLLMASSDLWPQAHRRDSRIPPVRSSA